MKRLLCFLFLIFFFSCGKDFNNPYDRECPPEIWSPNNLSASLSSGAVVLSWEQQATHFDGFVLERSTDSINWIQLNSGFIDKSAITYTDSGNLPVGKVYYRISAIADQNQSNYSYAKSICLVPAAPGTITGYTDLPQNSQGIEYSIAPVNGALNYFWTIPAGATIVSGQGTVSIKIDFGTTGGNLTVQAVNSCGNSTSTILAITLNLTGHCIFGNFTDSRDSRVYKTIQIGTQTWMAENLAYLPSVSPPGPGSFTVPYYYVYSYSGNDVNAAKATSYYNKYGVLYNWPAAMNGAASSNANPSGVQGCCPQGWHLPSLDEWRVLENYLIYKGYGYGGSGSDIAKSLASTTDWLSYSTPGTPGNDLATNNKSCFSGQP